MAQLLLLRKVLQWRPVDPVTNRPQKSGRINEVALLTELLFGPEQSGDRNNEVAIRQGSTVPQKSHLN